MATMVISDPFVNWTKKGKMSHNGKARSKTFPGIAAAMASQWTDYLMGKQERMEYAS